MSSMLFKRKLRKHLMKKFVLAKDDSKSFWRSNMAKQKSKTTKKIKTTISKNAEELAEALGLPKSTAIEWQIRYEVTEEIFRMFHRNHMTITEFAKKAETSRARITRILKKDTSDISLDVLFRVLGATGQKVEMRFSKAS